ncbi:hypothetical protein ES332_D09G149300v1 [Gossypium tomentosum]|uniref:Uncharacterized protein n=1 Tax=Gossypium tomentosum TaxID=34277 RepID=A0A5D2JI87_GOSTO|nr:hypothetical protein ES332_D09G149300v1 [Gossypium tomentosum]
MAWWFLISFSIVMKISCINLSALWAVILLHILISSSSFCVGHGDVSSGERNHIISSRKLLSSLASFPTHGKGAAMKEPKKAVEPGLRKMPPSVPNPTQN